MAGGAVDARLARAHALHTRAIAENSAARPAAADVLLRRSLALVVGTVDAPLDDVVRAMPRDRVSLVVRILITGAKAQAELGGLALGLDALDQAARIADEHADRSVTVSIKNQRGLLLLRSGDMLGALAEFLEAERGFGAAPPLDRCNVLLNRGAVRLNQGDLADARTDLSRCARLASRAGLALLQAMAEHNRGYLEFLVGNIAAGLEAMDTAARTSGHIPVGVSYLDRARLLVEAGLTREADAILADAGAIFARDHIAQDLAETELARAQCALVAGDIAAARRYAGRARDRFRRRGNDRWRRSAELVLLQGDLAASRPGVRLVEPALRLQSEFSAEGLRLPALTAALIAAEAYLAAGHPEAAAGILATAGSVRRRDPITTRLHTRYVQARLEAAGGRTVAAARQARAGLGELAAYQASFGSIDLQTAGAVHGRRIAELDLGLALSSGRAASVFAAAERARAASSRLTAVRSPADARAADLLAELRQTVESLQVLSQDRHASAPLLRRRRELERLIVARGWTLAGAGAARPVARLAEIRAAVAAADARMVIFVEAAGALHAVVAGEGRLGLHELGRAAGVTEQVRRVRADLDVLAQPRLPGPLSAAVRGSLERSVGELEAALLAPLRLDGRRLVIVSTGVLGQVPWGMLSSLRGVPIVVAPSATAWLAAVDAPERARRPDVIALAGPDLARAEHEVTGVVAAWGKATAHTGAAAARHTLARALTRGTVVHVAAHGVHQTENPLFSSLRLADGVAFAHELDQTARTPEHVVLSACELGLATVRPGDEGIGLTSVLLRLGTRSVVAGVARVQDEVAAQTMITYHRLLAAGQDSAAALAEATSALGREVTAPFVCFGASWRGAR